MHGKDRNKTIIYADNTNDSSILFDIGRDKKLTLTNLTLQGQQGILIRNYGTVILENVTVRNSRANIIENYGNITIRNSNFTSISSQHIITDKSSATGKNIEIINTEFNNCNVDKNTVFLDIKKSDLKVENVSFKNIDNIKNIITLRNTSNVLLDGVYMLKNTPSEVQLYHIIQTSQLEIQYLKKTRQQIQQLYYMMDQT